VAAYFIVLYAADAAPSSIATHAALPFFRAVACVGASGVSCCCTALQTLVLGF
jgi:hypothetical protein